MGFTYIPCRSDGTTVRPLTLGQEVEVIHLGRRQKAWIREIRPDGSYLLTCSDGARVQRDRMSISD